MTPAEVIAIEVKQCVGEGVKTLVPRVIGQTAGAETKKRASGPQRQWDEESFFSDLAKRTGPEAVSAARELFDWATKLALEAWWGHGKIDGSFIPILDLAGRRYYPIAIWSYGSVEFQFQHMNLPPFDDHGLRKDFLSRLNQIPGVSLPDDAITRRPSLPLADLGRNPKMLSELKAVLDWFCERASESV